MSQLREKSLDISLMTLEMVSNPTQKLSSQLKNLKPVKLLLMLLQPLLPKLKPMLLPLEPLFLTISMEISFSSMLDIIIMDSVDIIIMDSVLINLLVDMDSALVLVLVLVLLTTDGLRLVTTLNSPLLTPPMTSRSSLSPTTSLRNIRLPRRSQE